MPHARLSDPTTSHEAAASVSNVSSLKSLILEQLESPKTDPELLRAIQLVSDKPVSESGVRSRRAELVEMGFVRDSGARQDLPSGRKAIVWHLAKYAPRTKLPCDTCGVLIDADIHAEELGFCVDCSNAYFSHEDEVLF
jgi:hypothetical protein